MTTKARTEGRKRKQRKDRIADAPREENGRIQRESRREANQQMAQVEARMKRLAIWPAPMIRGHDESDAEFAARDAGRQAMIRGAMAYVLQPWMGCCAGRAVKDEPDVVSLWSTITAIRQCRHAYLVAIGCQPEDAIGMQMPTKSAGVEGEARKIDPRNVDERTRDAIDAWGEMTAVFYGIGPGVTKAIMATVIHNQEPGRFPLVWALGRIRKAMDA